MSTSTIDINAPHGTIAWCACTRQIKSDGRGRWANGFFDPPCPKSIDGKHWPASEHPLVTEEKFDHTVALSVDDLVNNRSGRIQTYQPCQQCGDQVYDDHTLAQYAMGRVHIDLRPTHFCQPKEGR